MKSALLWNTYGKDIEWFARSARSYKKFASGWDYAKCIVPTRDVELFKRPCGEAGIALAHYPEIPRKGFLHHLVLQCMGELHFPADATFISHIDADCVFARPSRPENWRTPEGKIWMPCRPYSIFLKEPLQADEMQSFMGLTGAKMEFNRGQYFWKFATDFALGWDCKTEAMAWMPITHHRETYEQTRKLISARHRTTFEQYVLSCRNEFPQSFCEFNALGAVAEKFFPHHYQWHDISVHGYPVPPWGNVVQCHSHSGLDYDFDFGGHCGPHVNVRTPRQLFQLLGV